MRRSIVICTALLALAMSSPAHAATWADPQHLEDLSTGTPVELLTDAAGNAVIAYTSTQGDVFARYRPAGGGPSTPQLLGRTPYPVDLSVAPDGRAMLLWVDSSERASTGAPSGVRAAFKAPGEASFGAPVALSSGARPSHGVVGALGGGDATVGWIEHRQIGPESFESDVMTRVRDSGQGGFQPEVRIRGDAIALETGLAADGSGFVAWGHRSGFELVRRDPDGDFSPMPPLNLRSEVASTGPELAVSPSGRAVIATSSGGPGRANPAERHIVAALGNTRDGFTEPAIVSGPGARVAAVGIGPDDRAVALWRAGNGSRSRVQALIAERDESRADPDFVDTLSPDNARGEEMALGNGRIGVVWQRKQGNGRNIELSTSETGEDFEPPRRVQRLGDGSLPEAGASRGGTLWIAWSRRLGQGVVNAAQVYASNGRLSRVTRVSDNGNLEAMIGTDALQPGAGGRMLIRFAHVAHVDVAGYAGG